MGAPLERDMSGFPPNILHIIFKHLHRSFSFFQFRNNWSASRNWSDIPPDLLHVIIKKLHSPSDFIRFRKVCRSWRSAPRFPLLLEEYCSLRNRYIEYHRSYSIFYRKICNIHCPESMGKQLWGSSYDYLFSCCLSEDVFSILNPITSDEVCLPCLDLTGSIPWWIGSHPIQNNEYVVVFGYSYDTTKPKPKYGKNLGIPKLAFCRPGDKEWIYMECSSLNYDNSARSIDKGKYFNIDKKTWVTKVIDIATQTLCYEIPPPSVVQFHENYSDFYFVHSSIDNEILLVYKSSWYHDVEAEKLITFNIYRLDVKNENNRPIWVKISSIGDQVIFLGAEKGLSCTSADVFGFKGNCIYYFGYESHKSSRSSRTRNLYRYNIGRSKTRGLYRYNIRDQWTEKLHYPFKGTTWLVPTVI